MIFPTVDFQKRGFDSSYNPPRSGTPRGRTRSASQAAPEPVTQNLATLLASDLKAEADRARDAGRMPAEVIAFLGIEPGMSVIDHHGVVGNDNKALHRMSKEDAIRVVKAAGFLLEADSGLLHIHSDDMSQVVFAEGVRGKTHRFLLKFRKPEA